LGALDIIIADGEEGRPSFGRVFSPYGAAASGRRLRARSSGEKGAPESKGPLPPGERQSLASSDLNRR
jgi:hypothetical protein